MLNTNIYERRKKDFRKQTKRDEHRDKQTFKNVFSTYYYSYLYSQKVVWMPNKEQKSIWSSFWSYNIRPNFILNQLMKQNLIIRWNLFFWPKFARHFFSHWSWILEHIKIALIKSLNFKSNLLYILWWIGQGVYHTQKRKIWSKKCYFSKQLLSVVALSEIESFKVLIKTYPTKNSS